MILWVYDISSNTWSEIKTKVSPSRRDFHSAVNLNNKMYVFGGYGDGYLNDLWVYDPENNTWEELKTDLSPSERQGHTAQAINDKLYVFGGYNGNNFFNDTWVYDPENNTWEELKTDLSPSERLMVSSTVINNKIIIFGGLSKFKKGNLLNDLWIYDPSNNTWEELKTELTPSSRVDNSIITIKNKIFIFGGYKRSGYLNDLWELSLSKN